MVVDCARARGHLGVAAYGPEDFYRKLGFEPTGDLIEGEVVGRLRLGSAA
jgi:predicted N-acetyltransferase YhbS